MSKIMIVEDDASLREVYSIRLTAEGYTVVSAGDGEEALSVAVKEKPDLIIADVMMPKISGFDMLDILRATPETANVKVIMMTALSSEEQRERGEKLGADRYLVKSQVGIEDVVRVVHDVLGDQNPAPDAGGEIRETALPTSRLQGGWQHESQLASQSSEASPESPTTESQAQEVAASQSEEATSMAQDSPLPTSRLQGGWQHEPGLASQSSEANLGPSGQPEVGVQNGASQAQ